MTLINLVVILANHHFYFRQLHCSLVVILLVHHAAQVRWDGLRVLTLVLQESLEPFSVWVSSLLGDMPLFDNKSLFHELPDFLQLVTLLLLLLEFQCVLLLSPFLLWVKLHTDPDVRFC